jgi:hypothetical protein
MDQGPLSHLHLPHELSQLSPDDPRADALLTRWDELSPERLAQLATHPTFGPRLARLREAEAWLGRGLAARHAREAELPESDELYDYAGGPSSVAQRGALGTERRRAIERHLEAEPEEAAWVAGLQHRPPGPLLFDAPVLLDAGTHFGATRPRDDELTDDAPRAHSIGRWFPLMAAAVVLGIGVTLVHQNRAQFALPSAVTLRSALAEPLHFPRGRVLGAPEGAVGLFAREPRYEFRALPDATDYRVELRRHSGSAFDAGVVEWSKTTSAPAIDGPPLTEGHYSWEVFATVNGLERSLGTQTFHVAHDAAALAQFSKEPLAGQVQRLTAAGLLTDARHRARLLPPGPERDRFLGSVPAR